MAYEAVFEGMATKDAHVARQMIFGDLPASPQSEEKGFLMRDGTGATWRFYINSSDIFFSVPSSNKRIFYFDNTSTGGEGLAIGISSGMEETAQLELSSTSRGFLPPRMTTTQRDAISSPATGLMIYNTTTNKLNVYTGSAWEAITSA